MVYVPDSPDVSDLDRCYQQMRERVAGFTDRLGMPVDEGIFDAVVFLNLLGITTLQSCEGHLDRGCFYPWVDVVDQEMDRLITRRWLAVCDLQERAKETETQEAYDQWLAADVALRLMIARYEQNNCFHKHLVDLLEAFYLSSSPGPARLMVRRFRSESRYRIEPGFTNVEKSIPEERKPLYLKRAQAEMQMFTSFLRARYFCLPEAPYCQSQPS